jgi:glutamate racemase
VARTQSGVVGVLATTQTLSAPKFARLVSTHAGTVQVLTQPCPGLVERVESGHLTAESTRALVEQYVRPLVEKGADTIVLGCTHYPFLIDVIRRTAGPGVTVMDSAVPVARELRRRLQSGGLLAPGQQRGTEAFWTTGAPSEVRGVFLFLWAADVDLRAVPSRLVGERSPV